MVATPRGWEGCTHGRPMLLLLLLLLLLVLLQRRSHYGGRGLLLLKNLLCRAGAAERRTEGPGERLRKGQGSRNMNQYEGGMNV